MPTMHVELAGLQGGLVQHQVCVVRQLQHSRLEPVGLVVLTRAERQLVHVLQAHRQQVALKHHTHLIHSVLILQNNFKSASRKLFNFTKYTLFSKWTSTFIKISEKTFSPVKKCCFTFQAFFTFM